MEPEVGHGEAEGAGLVHHIAQSGTKGSFLAKLALMPGSVSHPMIFGAEYVVLQRGVSTMRIGIRISSLVPSGVVVESVSDSIDSSYKASFCERSGWRYPHG